jgi:hypothetical protein
MRAVEELAVHPPLFQPFSVSESTIRYTAQSNIVPWILVSNPPDGESRQARPVAYN